jgi:hypothetical protein
VGGVESDFEVNIVLVGGAVHWCKITVFLRTYGMHGRSWLAWCADRVVPASAVQA